MTEFELSRVQAEGWNTANKLTAAEALSLDDAAIAARNPYANEPALSRWHAGFAAALKT